MPADNPSFPVTYSGQTDPSGEVVMTVPWDLPFAIKVTAIAPRNDRPCDNVEHLLTMALNGDPIVNDLPFRGCDPVPPQPVSSAAAEAFVLELKMTGFSRGKVTLVSGTADVYYAPPVAMLRLPKSITIPFKADADGGGNIAVEAAWEFPLEITVTGLFIGSRGPADRSVHKARVRIAANEQVADEEFDFRGTPGGGTTSLAVRGNAFRMSVSLEGFERGARVRGAVLVTYDT